MGELKIFQRSTNDLSFENPTFVNRTKLLQIVNFSSFCGFFFRMHWAREIGLIGRILNNRQTKRPTCQSVYIVFPVKLSDVSGIYFFFVGKYMSSLKTQ